MPLDFLNNDLALKTYFFKVMKFVSGILFGWGFDPFTPSYTFHIIFHALHCTCIKKKLNILTYWNGFNRTIKHLFHDHACICFKSKILVQIMTSLLHIWINVHTHVFSTCSCFWFTIISNGIKIIIKANRILIDWFKNLKFLEDFKMTWLQVIWTNHKLMTKVK